MDSGATKIKKNKWQDLDFLELVSDESCWFVFKRIGDKIVDQLAIL